jgi:glutathione S-transferase
MNDTITLYGSFTSSSSYKPMLYLSLARIPYAFKTVNLKTGVQRTPDYLAINRYGKVPAIRHRGLTIVNSNVILDYLARLTGQFDGATEQEETALARLRAAETDAVGSDELVTQLESLGAAPLAATKAGTKSQAAADRRRPLRRDGPVNSIGQYVRCHRDPENRKDDAQSPFRRGDVGWTSDASAGATKR